MAGASTYLGTLCKRQHNHKHSGKSLRYVNNPGCCVECRKITSSRWADSNSDRHQELKRNWQTNNKQHSAVWKQVWRRERSFVDKCLQSVKDRSKGKQLPFNLTKDYLVRLWKKQNGRCYWLNIELKPSNKRHWPTKPTLDRLIPNRGYTKGNVVWASSFANLGRNNASVKDFRAFLKTF